MFWWTATGAIFPLPVGRKMPPNAHGLSQWEKFIRPLHLTYCSQSRFCFTASNLWPEAIVRSIFDAIFLLPVTRSKSSNVQSLSQWEKFTRPLHFNYCSQSRFWFTALNLRSEAIVLSISDAIFLLPVTRS